MSRPPVLVATEAGLSCPAGSFSVDAWRPVERCVVTHAHSDHARPGMDAYLCARGGEGVLRVRLGDAAKIEALDYGETRTIGGARVSLHPAGHILGSAQVRIEVDGEVAVVSGDYKRAEDPTCAPFEPVRCHLFVTECTFGLPIYRWRAAAETLDQVRRWWAENRAAGRASLLMGYALGKCQRVLAALDSPEGPILEHGAVRRFTQAYREAGVDLPPTLLATEAPRGFDWSGALILATPGAHATPWARRFGEVSTAFLSGWMAVRGARRRRAIDRGFVLSDHVDWPGLLETIGETGAERVWATHGYADVVARYLGEQGIGAEALATAWDAGDEEEAD